MHIQSHTNFTIVEGKVRWRKNNWNKRNNWKKTRRENWRPCEGTNIGSSNSKDQGIGGASLSVSWPKEDDRRWQNEWKESQQNRIVSLNKVIIKTEVKLRKGEHHLQFSFFFSRVSQRCLDCHAMLPHNSEGVARNHKHSYKRDNLLEKENKIKISYLNLTLYLCKQKKVSSGLKDETTNGIRAAHRKGKKNTQISHVKTSCYGSVKNKKNRNAIIFKE